MLDRIKALFSIGGASQVVGAVFGVALLVLLFMIHWLLGLAFVVVSIYFGSVLYRAVLEEQEKLRNGK